MDRNEAISREEAVRTISRISGGSVSYAEDLYDSLTHLLLVIAKVW